MSQIDMFLHNVQTDIEQINTGRGGGGGGGGGRDLGGGGEGIGGGGGVEAVQPGVTERHDGLGNATLVFI